MIFQNPVLKQIVECIVLSQFTQQLSPSLHVKSYALTYFYCPFQRNFDRIVHLKLEAIAVVTVLVLADMFAYADMLLVFELVVMTELFVYADMLLA